MSSINITTNAGGDIGEAVSRLRRVGSALEPTAEDMLALGEIVWERNQDRTARGMDVYGNDFKEYSPRYARFKIKHGHTTNVDLIGVESGHPHMMLAMEVWESGPGEVKIGFRDKASRAAQKALGHLRGMLHKNLPVRRFFGLTMDDRAEVMAKRVEQIQDKLKGLS